MTDDFIVAAAQLACLLEASAPKPGNVSPDRHFHDARYEDFLASAAALGPALAGDRPLGATIHAAVQATARWTRSNTNLGIVLLIVPLARAARAAQAGARETERMHPGEAATPVIDKGSRAPKRLREALGEMLAATTVEDAREVYAAIRLARPGGLGAVSAEDVAAEPRIALRETMRLAAERDGVAREYATDFETTFELGFPTLRAALATGAGWEPATVDTYLHLLAAAPDTHIARRHGAPTAAAVSRGAAAVLAGRVTLSTFDHTLRERRLNPGTTADLTAASLFVGLLSGLWHADH